MTIATLTVRLPHRLAEDGLALARAVTDSCFALRRPEHRFVHRMQREHTHVWLFRCNQRRFCGDFVAVVMSAGAPERRASCPIELKQRAPLRIDRARRIQLANHRAALAEIAERLGIITQESPVVALLGDPDAVCDWFRRRTFDDILLA
jgi:hypothetical protein